MRVRMHSPNRALFGWHALHRKHLIGCLLSKKHLSALPFSGVLSLSDRMARMAHALVYSNVRHQGGVDCCSTPHAR